MNSGVDVVVPCYNYGRFLRQCVESVLAQEVVSRVLIIDDASDDDSQDVAQSLTAGDSRVGYRRHRRNVGPVRTFNEGIEWASAKYVMVLSADDYLISGALKRSTELMDRFDDVGFTFGKALDVVGDDQVQHTRTLANDVIDRVLLSAPSAVLTGSRFFQVIAAAHATNIVRTPSVVVRTSLQRALGGYRSDLSHTHDFEMWLRLAAHAKVGIIGDYQAAYRIHENNFQKRFYRAWMLPDLEQRKAAIDAVFARDEAAIHDLRTLHRSLLGALALESTDCARAALAGGDADSSGRLATFAVHTDPSVRLSFSWFLLFAYKALGPVVLPRLLPLARRLRGAIGGVLRHEGRSAF